MNNFVESIFMSFSLAALFMVLWIFLFNLYLIMKNGFYVNANCWFCNTWTYVLYAERNSFECPSCEQYNGFQEDGGYNRVIEAQHATLSYKFHSNGKTVSNSNGLCSYCNYNQQLKIKQLALFTPLNADNFDVEVEHFRQQLERVYQLCKKCEKVLKTTIGKNNAWVFGKFSCSKIRNQGFKLINSTKASHCLKNRVEQSFCLTLIKCILVLLTIMIICQLLNVEVDYPTPKANLKKLFEPHNTVLMDILNLVHHKTINIREELLSSPTLISCIGFLLQSIMLFEKQSTMLKMRGLLAWCLLLISSSMAAEKEFAIFCQFLKIFSSFMLLYTYMMDKAFTATGDISKKKIRIENVFISNSSPKQSSYKDFISSCCSSLLRRWCTSFRSAAVLSTTTSPRPLYNKQQVLKNKFGIRNATALFQSKKPILTPPNLKHITQKSWTAVGFWNDDYVADAKLPQTNQPFCCSSRPNSRLVSTTHNNINQGHNSCLCSHRNNFPNGVIGRVGAVPHVIPTNTFNHLSPQQLYYKVDNNNLSTNYVSQWSQTFTMRNRGPFADGFSFASNNNNTGSVRSSGYLPLQNLNSSFSKLCL